MTIIGNILWFIFGGFISGLSWFVAGLLCCISIIGIPLGVIVYITDTNGICKNRVVNFITGTIINILRRKRFRQNM